MNFDFCGIRNQGLVVAGGKYFNQISCQENRIQIARRKQFWWN